jgi:hypothetical protein
MENLMLKRLLIWDQNLDMTLVTYVMAAPNITITPTPSFLLFCLDMGAKGSAPILCNNTGHSDLRGPG